MLVSLARFENVAPESLLHDAYPRRPERELDTHIHSSGLNENEIHTRRVTLEWRAEISLQLAAECACASAAATAQEQRAGVRCDSTQVLTVNEKLRVS